jgi:multicomponent Na+:H+ antiporter subunit E
VAALAATFTSLRLLPPGKWRPRPLAVAAIVLRFMMQSVVAGVDVASRALASRPRLRPGLVPCGVRTAPGPARSAFCAFTSLLPGTMPSGFDPDGRLLVHCLDVERPVAAELKAEERRLQWAFGGRSHG